MTPRTLGLAVTLTSLIGLGPATPSWATNAAAYSRSMPKTFPRAYALWRAHLPHRCTLDEADGAVTPDGDKIFGVILHHGRPIRVGRSTDGQMACLRAFAESYVPSKC